MQNAGTGSVSFSKHGNGLVEVRLEGGEPEMYDRLAAVLDECGESEGLVLRIGKAPCSNGLAQLSANLKSADLQATSDRLQACFAETEDEKSASSLKDYINSFGPEVR